MRHILLPLIAVIVASFLLVLWIFASHNVAHLLTTQAQRHIPGTLSGSYEPERALRQYQIALALDPDNETALYNAARLSSVLGDQETADTYIGTYLRTYPENKRIHYVAGLSYAAAGDLDKAQESFETFIASGLSQGFGQLDLAWILFQKGEFEEAQELLEFAIAEYGDNVWFSTALGANLVAQEQFSKAQDVLVRAQQYMRELTPREWQRSYSFNDPSEFAADMLRMEEVIAFNLSLARGENPTLRAEPLVERTFVAYSPLGPSHGISVSACAGASGGGGGGGGAGNGPTCAPNQGQTCRNVCGASGSIGCDGSCSVTDPSGVCSVSNTCGSVTGSLGCNAACNVTSYPVCSASGIGEEETTFITLGEGGEFSASEIALAIFAAPSLVREGQTTHIQWVSTETSSCTVTSDRNDDSWTGRFGEEESSGIFGETLYTVTCTAFDDSTHSDSIRVRTVPVFQEF